MLANSAGDNERMSEVSQAVQIVDPAKYGTSTLRSSGQITIKYLPCIYQIANLAVIDLAVTSCF